MLPRQLQVEGIEELFGNNISQGHATSVAVGLLTEPVYPDRLDKRRGWLLNVSTLAQYAGQFKARSKQCTDMGCDGSVGSCCSEAHREAIPRWIEHTSHNLQQQCKLNVAQGLM